MDETPTSRRIRRLTPAQLFRRGLAISLPPILTLVIVVWLLRAVNNYVITPASTGVRYIMAQFVDESASLSASQFVRLQSGPPLEYCETNYVVTPSLSSQYREFVREDQTVRASPRPEPRPTAAADDDGVPLAPEAFASEPVGQITGPALLDQMQAAQQRRIAWLNDRVRDEEPQVYVPFGGRAVPYDVFAVVASSMPSGDWPTTSTGVYMDYVAKRYFGSVFHLSAVAVTSMIALLYFVGRIVTVQLGAWVVHQVESNLLGRLPVIRNVYGSVKQVTDFLFTESKVEYRRVVAIEYPRHGIWSIGFVTGDAMLDVTAAAGEPCVNILVPTSPMPATGYTMTVPRSSLLDLNITIDQAFQFCISCGVLIPPHQSVTPEVLQQELARRLSERMLDSATYRRPPVLRAAPPAAGDAENASSEVHPLPQDPAT
jgi:uncharacterized membrane protein